MEYKGIVDMIGQLLARRYQILRVLGAGAFGQTYVAQDTHIPGNPTCVVKHLKPASNSPNLLETARQLFQREAETLVKLSNHEQIPQLLAYFEEDQEFYLVQEFIEGHTLTQELLPGQQLPENQVRQLLVEILEILEFVHNQGVIHRDIKPDNIMRRDLDHKLVLIDFGAIKQVQVQPLVGQEQSVATSIRIGTPGYTPTEQDWGKPRPSSDIYALGRVAIQALTGVYPYQLEEDDETGELIWQHLAPVSPGVAAILTKMVRYHFRDRYQSAAEVLQSLQQLPNLSHTTTLQATVKEYIPTQKPTQQALTLLQPVVSTAQPTTIQTTRQSTISSSSKNQTLRPVRVRKNPSFTSNHRLPLLMKLGVAALVIVGGGYAYLQGHSSNLGSTNTSTAKLDSTVYSKPTNISTAKSDSTVHSNSTDISTAKSDSTAHLVRKGTLITNSDSTANLVTSVTLITEPDLTPSSDRKDLLITNLDVTPGSDKKDALKVSLDSTAKSGRTGKSSLKSDSTEPLIDNGLRQLKNARQKAREGDFQKAIALAEQISFKSSVYQQALNEIAQWQGQQRQQLIKQQAEHQARTLLSKATDIAQTRGDTDMETAIRTAEEAIAQVPPDSPVSREAHSAIAKWQEKARAKQEQEAVASASSYTCSCQPNEPDAQNAITYTQSRSDLTGSSCAIDQAPDAKVVRVWQCNQK
ncbi:MAG TPA: serine/threonine-protein kinase [Allocoleopsis sp.]